MKTIQNRLFGLRPWIRLIASATAILFLSGCAEVVIEKEGNGKGYDVYRPEPYLLVFAQNTLTETNSAETNPTETKPTDTNSSATNSPATNIAALAAAGGSPGGTPNPNPQSPTPPSTPPATGANEGLNGPGMEIVWLPNYRERYRVHSSAFFLSKAGAQFTIQNGWMLTGVTDQSDNTALLTAAQTIFSSALSGASSTASKAATAASLAAETGPKTNSVAGSAKTKTQIWYEWHVYKFLFDTNGDFYGLSEITQRDGKYYDAVVKDVQPALTPNPAPAYKWWQNWF